MKTALILLLGLLSISPVLAQDTPVLTSEGLENFKLGQAPPKKTTVEGFTFKRVETVERAEGEEYRKIFFKFFQNGHYFGKAEIGDQGTVVEITIVDPLARYEGGFAVGSSWDEVQRVFPRVELHYTYVMDKIFAHSAQLKGLQVLFDPQDHTGPEQLDGEYVKLQESSLRATAKAKALRLFKVP